MSGCDVAFVYLRLGWCLGGTLDQRQGVVAELAAQSREMDVVDTK